MKRGKLTERERLLEELTECAREIDEEGLVFLLEQANILLRNARVRELEAKRAKDPAPEPGATGTKSGRRRAPPTASIEQSPDGKAFFLVLGEIRKSLARAELNALLKICALAPDTPEAARRLYAHLGRERRDILVDAGITDATHALLRGLAEHARARAVKGGEG